MHRFAQNLSAFDPSLLKICLEKLLGRKMRQGIHLPWSCEAAYLDVVEILVLLSLLVLEVALLLEALHPAAGRVATVLEGAPPENEIHEGH